LLKLEAIGKRLKKHRGMKDGLAGLEDLSNR